MEMSPSRSRLNRNRAGSFRLRDKGVKPVRGGARGDLFCKVVIETPVKLSAEQRELIRRLDESLRGGASMRRARRVSWKA